MRTQRDRVLALRPWNPNPLMRRSDRVESWILIAVATCCLAMVPVASSIGATAYATAAERIRVADAAKSEVVATIVGTPANFGRTRPVFASAQWRRAGESGTVIVQVSSIAQRGDRIRIWLTPDQRPTTPPGPSTRAISAGFRAAAAILMGACGAALLIAAVARWCATRYQRSHWDQAWKHLDKPT